MAQQLIICQILFSIRPINSGSCTDGVIQKSVKVTKCLTCHYVSYQIGVERNVFQKKNAEFEALMFSLPPSRAHKQIEDNSLGFRMVCCCLMHCDWHDLPDPLRHAPTNFTALVQSVLFCGWNSVCVLSLVGCSSHIGLKFGELGKWW